MTDTITDILASGAFTRQQVEALLKLAAAIASEMPAPSGGVTSVGMTAPTGFSITGSPITTAGTLGLSFAAGYSLPTSAKQANWDAAFGWGNHASAGYAASSTLSAHIGATGAAHGVATTSVAGFMSAADKAKLNGIAGGATANTGTVTSVSAGAGMSFTTIDSAGSVSLGTPGSVTLSSTNSATSGTHTHSFAPGGSSLQYITGTGALATFPTIPSLPISVANGGTGATSATSARTNLGLGTVATYNVGISSGTVVTNGATVASIGEINLGSTGNGLIYVSSGTDVSVRSNNSAYFVFSSAGNMKALNGRFETSNSIVGTTGTTSGLYEISSGAWLIRKDSGANRIQYDGGCAPGTDGTFNFGQAALRWSQVFAVTGTINTSDARDKSDVSPLTANELAASVALGNEIGTYQWLSAIADKGEAAARLHIGMTVQRAIEIMEVHGLDPMRYGFICYDAWDEEPERVDEELGVVVQPLLPAGDRYSFRMDELLAFIARGFAARLTAIEAKLDIMDEAFMRNHAMRQL